MHPQPSVIIIGAGSSGIPCVKAMKDAGLEVVCLEAGSQVGGNWCLDNDNGMSSAYDSLHINTSRPKMEYADYPMPAHYPDFPGHRHIKQYFDDYVDHFELRSAIRFGARVTGAERRPHGGWRVHTTESGCFECDALLVANGHHWDPRWPDPPYPGEFSGQVLHSHYYRNPSRPVDLTGKRVLVVGLGNSAMDIACELGRPGLTEKVVLSSRSSAWIIPKYLFGRPLDQVPAPPDWLPWRLRSAIITALLTLAAGRPDRYGLPRPDHRLLSSHPTVSQDVLGKFGSGDLTWRPDIQRLDGHTVEFTDGHAEDFDVIIYCTGYHVSFPFLSPALAPVQDNRLDLWLRMVRPEVPDLFFIGLMQPLGAIMPLAEAQAGLVAGHLSGQLRLPDASAMRREIDKEMRALTRRYRTSARHTMQVDFDTYMNALGRVVRRGRRFGGTSGPHPFWSRMDDLPPIAPEGAP